MSKGFADIFNHYQTYDTSKGFGNASQWRSDFRDRMGLDEAKSIIHGSPEEILGVSLSATWNDIRVAYRKRSRETHPDCAAMNGMTDEQATEAFKQVAAAFTILKHRMGKA